MNKNLQTDCSRDILFLPVVIRHLFLLIVALVFARGAEAASVMLKWEPVVSDSLVTGYEMHYGPTSGQYQWVIEADINGAATDTQLVENLVVGDTYCFAVRSRNQDRSMVSTFSNEVCDTIASSSDTIPPTVSISTTLEGPTYTSAQTVTVGASASDNVGVTRVEFYDGTTLKGTDTTSPYSYAWSINSADNGSHSWTARAYDAAGNNRTSGALSRSVNISYEPLAGLVAAYSFEEAEGNAVTDVSGNGNDGLIYGASRTTAGRFDSALSFDGVDDWIDLNAMDIVGGGLTMSVWMKADDFGTYDARLVSKATGVYDDDHYWMLSTFANNSVRFRLKAGGSTTTLISNGGVIAAGQWYHVAATYDGARMRLYVDGVDVGSIAKTGVIDINADVPAGIGNQPQGDMPFDGLIDEVRLYNRSLTVAEIQADMVAPIGDSNNLVHTLRVTKSGTGSGTVHSNPTGINCGTDCDGSYAYGTAVTLTATPGTGSSFAGWSGDLDCADGRVTLDAATSCTATFSGIQRTLTVSKAGTGGGTVTSSPGGISCGTDCDEPYVDGTVVTLTATPENGLSFAGWSGDADCADGQVTMDAVKGCTATFNIMQQQQHTLTIIKAGTGDGAVTSSHGGISCGTDCDEPYVDGTVVTLMAAPENGSGFAGWSGDADCADGQVTMNTGTACTATFDAGTGVLLAYGFEEAEGTTVMDASGNGNDGLIYGASRTMAGRLGSALSFDGVDDWIDLNAMDIVGGGLTISVWMKVDDFGTYDARLVSKATGVYDDDHYWMLSTFENNSVRFRLKAGGSTTKLISDSGVITAGQWYHVAATYDGARMRLYVDGVEVGSIAKTGAIDTNGDVPAAIGNQPQGDMPFDGLIDEVRLYNRALTGAEIQADMVAPIDDSTLLAPTADFNASKTSGKAPLTITFVDISVGNIDSREWDFGDDTKSTASTAVHTYAATGSYTVSLTVTGPGGAATETKTDYITVTVPPVADFSASATSGTAPLTVDFTDTSSGSITAWNWNFGDSSGISTTQNPTHTYSAPGIYTVNLTASGPDGTDSEIKLSYITVSTSPDGDGGDNPQYPQWEVGEVEVDYQHKPWQWIVFEKPFVEPPIVVAKPLSVYDDTPATVRIRNIDSTGFEIRVQDWDYLNDSHGHETVSYLAMQYGSWELDDGTRIEANRLETTMPLETDATKFWKSVVFDQPFSTRPVVLAAVTTENEADAVTTRLRKIKTDQFQIRMYEQEWNQMSHARETISYIAWEPSSGTLDGVPFEVGETPNEVRHLPYAISYQSAFAAPPVFLADMQTTDGGDTSNLRWRNKTASSVEVWVQEEQSKDSEMRHTTEAVGYLSFGQ